MNRNRWLLVLAVILVLNVPGLVILTRSMRGPTTLVPIVATCVAFGVATWLVTRQD